MAVTDAQPPSGAEIRRRRQEGARQVLELYAAGRSVPEIADALGITQHKAASLLGHGIADSPSAEVQHLRALVDVRLDKLTATFRELINDPDSRIRLQAAQGLRQVEADRARLLGLNLKPRED